MGYVAFTHFCRESGFVANTRFFGCILSRLLLRHRGFYSDFVQISVQNIGGWDLCCVHGQKDKPDKNLQIFNFRYKLHICHHLHGGALNKAVNLGHSLKLGTFTKFRHFSASSPSPEAVDSIAVSLFSNNYSETSKLVYGAAEKATFCYQIWFLDNSTLSNEHALMLIEMDTDLAIAKQNLDLAKTSVCTFCVIWESFSMIL